MNQTEYSEYINSLSKETLRYKILNSLEYLDLKQVILSYGMVQLPTSEPGKKSQQAGRETAQKIQHELDIIAKYIALPEIDNPQWCYKNDRVYKLREFVCSDYRDSQNRRLRLIKELSDAIIAAAYKSIDTGNHSDAFACIQEISTALNSIAYTISEYWLKDSKRNDNNPKSILNTSNV